MLISSLVGKTVLSRSGERFGYILALRPARDLKKLSCLVCIDENEEEFYLPARAVISVEDAVIAGRQRAKSPTGILCPIGKPVYTHTGEQLGMISDIDTGDTPVLILSSDGEERRVDVSCAAMGETVIVYPTAEERRSAGTKRTRNAGAGRTTVKKSKTTHTSSNNSFDETTYPQTDSPEAVAQAEKTRSSVQESPAVRPQEARQSPSYSQSVNSCRLDRTNLLGKRLKKSVFDERGKPIALAGERITPEILARARRSNRLLALTVNTLTNLV